MDVQGGFNTALFYKQTHLLNYLYLAGADVNLPDAKGRTPLYRANDAETCKWLLDMGAQQVASPLYMACFRGDGDVVKLLLSSEQGIRFLTQRDRWGHTPLYKACLYRRVGIVKLLLSYEQGVQTIAQPNGWGNTPLHIACHNHDIDTVKLLLSHKQGVKTINQPDKFRITPLDDAKPYPEILALLQSYL
jgi:ankyrin repeat protein